MATIETNKQQPQGKSDKGNNDRARVASPLISPIEKQDSTTTKAAASTRGKKMKREICVTCSRPTPRACICAALPPERIRLAHCNVLVLQHPHETKMKNRSLPLIELCLHQDSIKVVTGRSFDVRGKNAEDPTLRQLLDQPDVMLLYPAKDCDDVVDFSKALEIIDERRQKRLRQKLEDDNKSAMAASSSEKITVILLDATWKFASEMHRANLRDRLYPEHMLFVSLTPTGQKASTETVPLDQSSASAKKDGGAVSENQSSLASSSTTIFQEDYKPRRFAQVRTPPNDDCLSTGECIAWVVSAIEEAFQDVRIEGKNIDKNPATTTESSTMEANDETIYQALLKPLDLMVAQWKSFTDKRGGQKVRDKLMPASRAANSQSIESSERNRIDSSKDSNNHDLGSGRKRKAAGDGPDVT